MYLVGGAVRDRILQKRSKDLDFTVVAPSFGDMQDYLVDRYDVDIFLRNPEYGTIRARFPRGTSIEFAGIPLAGRAADFVHARRDGYYSDGRHPDEVQPGSLIDDLSRRDFTINAMAQRHDGLLIDPFGGQRDLADRVIRAVGDPKKRLAEDGLRIVRALRFSVTLRFLLDPDLRWSMHTASSIKALDSVSPDRLRDELFKMFAEDSRFSLNLLYGFPAVLLAMEEKGIWLKPTLELRL